MRIVYSMELSLETRKSANLIVDISHYLSRNMQLGARGDLLNIRLIGLKKNTRSYSISKTFIYHEKGSQTYLIC